MRGKEKVQFRFGDQPEKSGPQVPISRQKEVPGEREPVPIKVLTTRFETGE
jgi:hypothetical protein